MDPLDLREKIDESPARKVERQIIREKTNWRNRKPAGADTGPVKRGMGIAQSVWYRFVNMDSSCEVRVSKDGSVELLSAVQDIGAGTKTMLAQVVAEEFGIPPHSVAGAHRRHALSDRAELRRQRDCGIDHAGDPQRCVAGEAEIPAGRSGTTRHDR